MKVMRTPKMDVVRFTESDVIVASSPVDNKFYANLANWGGTTENASLTITHSGTSYDFDWNQIVAGEQSGLFGNPKFGDVNLDDLVAGETDGTPDYYSYNGSWVSADGATYTRPRQ